MMATCVSQYCRGEEIRHTMKDPSWFVLFSVAGRTWHWYATASAASRNTRQDAGRRSTSAAQSDLTVLPTTGRTWSWIWAWACGPGRCRSTGTRTVIIDLVVSCPDVPFRGTYLFENPGGAAKMPVFKPPVLCRAGARATRRSRWSTACRACCRRASNWLISAASSFGKQRSIYPQSNIHRQRRPSEPMAIRRLRWGSGARLDRGRRRLDGLRLGRCVRCDRALDARALHGYVYLIRNRGSTAVARL